METGATISLTPTRAELLAPSPVHCAEKGCTAVFDSESHLNMHLARRHGMKHLLQKSDLKKIYHCPVETCGYNKNLHFKQLKLLKQHYMKVHAEKCFICFKCTKSFSTELSLRSHDEYCGILFVCSECCVSYGSYESLQTHCRRKKHKLLEKTTYKLKVKDKVKEVQSKTCKSDSGVCKKGRLLLPKGSDTYIVLVSTKETFDQGCQTDEKMLNSMETQTIGDYLPLKPTNSEQISIETQTKHTELETKACNTGEKLNLTDYAFGDVGVEQKNSATQTKDVQLGNPSLMDFEFLNCDTETQTDLFSDSLLDNCDFYSNMYTQTPSTDDMLLNDLEFNDNYTQTALYDDFSRSVESQTLLYNNHKKNLLLSNRDVANIETQTEWEQILQEMV